MEKIFQHFLANMVSDSVVAIENKAKKKKTTCLITDKKYTLPLHERRSGGTLLHVLVRAHTAGWLAWCELSAIRYQHAYKPSVWSEGGGLGYSFNADVQK